MPLLPALTLTAGEHQVSGPASYSTRSSLEAQNGLPHFLAAFSRLLSRRHGGATGILLRDRSQSLARCANHLSADTSITTLVCP